MSEHTHENMIPPGAIKAAGALVLATLALVAAVRVGVMPPSPTAAEMRTQIGTGVATERLLRFRDRADGAVVVNDARTGTELAVIGQEGGGFIRGTMRGLARERRQRGIGEGPPFRLALWRDGALSLTDPATGRILELNGFGNDNRAAFARLLEGTR